MKSSDQNFKKRDGAAISGACGFHNAGDDAVLLAMLEQLKQTDPALPVRVFSRDPAATKAECGAEAVPMFDLPQLWQVLRKSRLLLSGGGSLLQNATSGRSLCYYLAVILMAKCAGCRVMLYGCGIGPIRGTLSGFLTAGILNACADCITLRDSGSLRLLQKLGVRRPMHLTADPALTVRPDDAAAAAYFRENSLDPAGNYALFCLRPWKNAGENRETFHRAAAHVWRAFGLMPVFLPLCPESDGEFAEKLAKGLEVPHIRLPGCGKPETLCGVIGRMRLVVSMRLHGLIFACSRRIPHVGIAYDPKVSGFLEDTGNPNWVALTALTAGTLCACIDHAMQSPVPDPENWKKKAEENGSFAAELLKRT